MKLIVSLICVALACYTHAAPTQDLITNLPGLSEKVNFKQYSGFLSGEGTKKLHYWFVESQSNPKTDPVVLWLNGGPGCSSVLGFLTEHGPFRIADDGEHLVTFPFAWNQIANMIYLESPAGVGFSYSDDKNYTIDDDGVARNNYLALQDFFKKFPEYRDNDFYITGESYGGIYVPTLASLVMDDPAFPLKGFAVGNGLLDYDMNENSLVYFSYYHGLIGDKQWFNMVKTCCPATEKDLWCNFVAGSKTSEDCAAELTAIEKIVWGSGLNVYNLYSECAGGVQNHNLHYDASSDMFITSNFGWPFMFLKDSQANLRKQLSGIPLEKLKASPECTNDTASVRYMNNPSVRQALHIPDNVQKWETCSSDVTNKYVKTYTTMTPQYQKAMKKKVRVLVYNGDVDMACNFLGCEWFVDSLHAPNGQERKAWYYKAADGTKQVAGYVKAYDGATFVTIKGSGHMVPTDRPRPALEMFINFIQDQPY